MSVAAEAEKETVAVASAVIKSDFLNINSPFIMYSKLCAVSYVQLQ